MATSSPRRIVGRGHLSKKINKPFRAQYAGTSWGSSFHDAIKDRMKRFRRTTRVRVMEF